MTVEEPIAAKRQRLTPKRSPIVTLISVPRHPLGIKPSGNTLLLGNESHLLRADRLGSLQNFDDELLSLLISYIQSPRDLLALSHTSRVLYSFCYHDEVWKNIYLNNDGLQIETWLGSWRKSVLGLETEALIQANDTVFSDLLYRPYQCSLVDYNKIFKQLISSEQWDSERGESSEEEIGHIRRIPESQMTTENFNSNWHNTPFILTNRDDPHRWPLQFDIEYLSQHYSKETMRQEAVAWSLDLYFQYFKANRDESPLYLFDPSNKIIQNMKFEVPDAFKQDLFTLFDHCRPDHKWIIIGPAKSGSTFHKDPNTTSAWNTTIQGKKIWVMTPPHVTPPGVSTDETEEEVTSPIGLAEWVLSGFFNDALRLSETGDCLIGVTFPGECLYVPSGWWHTVINVDDSVAITANFLPLMKLDKVLNFFQNKNEQISGFHPNEVYVELERLITKLDDRDEVEFLQSKLSQLKHYKDEVEDIGELSDIKLPIFEIFVNQLRLNGYGKQLEESLERLKIEPKESWNSITVQKSSFSFGFEEDSDGEEASF